MKNIVCAVAVLLICGSVLADEPKFEIKKKPVVVDVQVVPKVGHPLPNPRPHPGQHYWRHPTYGYGYWYYPAPVARPQPNYYIDGYGRVVPNGYAYDVNGNLVPLQAAPVYQPYPYGYPYYGNYYGRWSWWRR